MSGGAFWSRNWHFQEHGMTFLLLNAFNGIGTCVCYSRTEISEFRVSG